MRDDRANHDDGKQTGRIEGIAWNQQTDAARDFQKTSEIPEPLAAADLVEEVYHSSGARQLGAAGPQKSQRHRTRQNPQRYQAPLAGVSRHRVRRYHKAPFDFAP